MFSSFLLLQLSNKITISPQWIMVLFCIVNFEHFSALLKCFHCIFCFSYNISHFQLFRKENVIMTIKHVKIPLLYCHCWWQKFFLLMFSQFCCKNRQRRWKKLIKLIKDQIEFDKIFDERNTCLDTQLKASNSYSLLPHRQPLVLWRQF